MRFGHLVRVVLGGHIKHAIIHKYWQLFAGAHAVDLKLYEVLQVWNIDIIGVHLFIGRLGPEAKRKNYKQEEVFEHIMSGTRLHQ